MGEDENCVLLSEVLVSTVSSDALVIHLGKDGENCSSETESLSSLFGVGCIGRFCPRHGPVPGATTAPLGLQNKSGTPQNLCPVKNNVYMM